MLLRSVAALDCDRLRMRSRTSNALCRKKTLVLPNWMPTLAKSDAADFQRGVSRGEGAGLWGDGALDHDGRGARDANEYDLALQGLP